ncbi:MAG: tetratricopeptide repeat protein [Planctomycetota bacterium]|nr:tetratricopeptide repeat protein [Planctomycetota bacterium]
MKRCAKRITACGLAPCLLMAALCAAWPAAAQEKGARERTFVRGLELFDTAKTPAEYREAAALWESLLVDGYQNGAVCYNIGNASMRAGDYGRAIAAYRKAKLYLPRYPYLEANLKQALMAAPGRLPEPPAPWWKHVLFWSDWLSYPEKFHAALGGFVAAVILATLGLLCRARKLYWFSGGVVVVALFLSVDAGLAYVDVSQSRHAVVVAETVARKGTGEKYEPAFDQPLKDGAEFIIIDRSGPWVFGHFEGIGDGWLHRDAVVE